MKHLFTSEALQYGWNSVKKNWRLFGVLFVGSAVVSIMIGILISVIGIKEGESGLASLIRFFLHTFLGLGFTGIALRLYGNHKTIWNDFFSSADLYWKYFAGQVVYMFIVVGGLILLIFPGIIWALKYKFVGYFIVDKKVGPIEALKMSAKVTDGAKWDLFGFCIALMLINLLGAICLGVGLLVTVPVSLMATTYIYKKLQNA